MTYFSDPKDFCTCGHQNDKHRGFKKRCTGEGCKCMRFELKEYYADYIERMETEQMDFHKTMAEFGQ